MAYLLVLLSILLSCMQVYGQQDPLNNVCRRWAHQTTVVGNRIYIDGGLVVYGSSIENQANVTNSYLLALDLDEFKVEQGQQWPAQQNNSSKPSYVPSVQGGILWPDTVNQYLYLYGGEYDREFPLQASTVWQYDVIANIWNDTGIALNGIQPASFGAGAVDDSGGVGYYYGGWLNENNTSAWVGSPRALSSLVVYDMLGNQMSTIPGPDNVQRAEGTMYYIPAGDGGYLVYLGGIQQPAGASNGSWTGMPMDSVLLYDIANARWYTQGTTGDTPPMRRRFCGGVSWPDDQSSYNIYFFGGLPTSAGLGYGDVYILSIPSFTWVKWFPLDGETEYPHHSLGCNVVNRGQLSITGGYYPNSSYVGCDVPDIWGQHNLNLGADDQDNKAWYQFLPNLTTYGVPSIITTVIGGGATGGAALTTPTQGFADGDLTLLTEKYTAAVRSPLPGRTTAAFNSTTSHNESSDEHVGIIAGAVVGGIVFLTACIALVWFCLRKRRDTNAARQIPPDTPNDAVYSPHISPQSPNKPCWMISQSPAASIPASSPPLVPPYQQWYGVNTQPHSHEWQQQSGLLPPLQYPGQAPQMVQTYYQPHQVDGPTAWQEPVAELPSTRNPVHFGDSLPKPP